MKNIFLICLIILTLGCEKEDYINPRKIYGLSYPFFHPMQSLEPDSIIEFDISTGNYKPIWAVNNFEGLDYCQSYVSSKNLDILIYSISSFDIGFIDMKNGSLERLSFWDDSTHVSLGSFEVCEESDRLFSICTYYDYTTKEFILGLDEIDLHTFEIVKNHMIAKKTNERILLSDIDSDSHTVYIISPSEKTLFIFNYLTEELTIRQLEDRFEDIHCYNNTLIGTSDFSLVSYSLRDNSSSIIGKYSELNSIVHNSYFFNKSNETYWIGTINSENFNHIDLININLKNAAINKRINLTKPILKLN